MTGDSFALVLPTVCTVAMNRFLTDFAATLAPQEHAVMVLDGAGWHGSKRLVVPDNVTLVPLPPYSPECNPVERIWLFLREKLMSLRVFPDQNAIIDACCDAWNALVAETGRVKSLCYQPWLQKVISLESRYKRPVHGCSQHLGCAVQTSRHRLRHHRNQPVPLCGDGRALATS